MKITGIEEKGGTVAPRDEENQIGHGESGRVDRGAPVDSKHSLGDYHLYPPG